MLLICPNCETSIEVSGNKLDRIHNPKCLVCDTALIQPGFGRIGKTNEDSGKTGNAAPRAKHSTAESASPQVHRENY